MAAAVQAGPAASGAELRCPMCGGRFDPRAHAGCAGCPLNSGCALACCPHCGFSSPDPAASTLARAFGKLRRRRS